MATRDTYLGLRAFVDELVRSGVRHACTSPGSRSTPLVLSLVRDGRLRTWSQIDERSGGFFAVGVAKATGCPAVLACTSGTAVANYLPAVTEAYEARVPLLVLTADRPAELRDLGAGQTIDQVKLFGRNAKWYLEVDEQPGTAERLRWLRQLACRAVITAQQGRPGPVHLNFVLREPLVLDEELPPDDSGRPGGHPWVRRPAPAAAAPQPLPGRRPLLVAGRDERSDGSSLAQLAAQRSVPLLADPLSGARRGAAAIAHYDAFLRVGAPPAPDLVVRYGDLPTSKPLRQWLHALACEQVTVDPEGAWQDPAGAVSRIVAAAEPPRGEPGWLESWRALDQAAAGAVAETLEPMSEPWVAREMARLPGTLVVASSMPIRDVETFFPLDAAPRVLANRGANGIDGTVSTAYGVAATGEPTTLLIGDVALIHDLGGLLAGPRLGLPLRIVVLNNDGGGIFHFLPVATQRDAFEAHVATPHGLDFERVAALFGLPYRLAAVPEDLAADGLIEVRSDRAANVELHRRVWESVRAAI